jgi:4-amino-4-deoxy-L-arabinose transferase-like glycosyltransferase
MTGAQPSRLRAWSAQLTDPLIFFGLFAGYLGALLGTVRDLGYARDEGFYYHAARSYGQWFTLLFSDPMAALQRTEIDRIWQENHEHPALMKSLFWVSQRLLGGRVFHEPGTATRFPAMVVSALAVAVIFAWGRRSYGRAGGVVAALAFACMPRVFYNSHLSCFDMPIAAVWLFVVYAYYRSLEPRRWGWALGTAVLYGLALDTKHNAWFLPAALVAHVLVRHVLELERPFRGWYRVRVPLAVLLMPLIGPLVCCALWPWLWHDTRARVVEWFQFHLRHVYYNMEFLGHTYFKPPFPRSYAWVMTLATVPAITLVLSLIGGLAAARTYWVETDGLSQWRRTRAAPDSGMAEPSAAPSAATRNALAALWVLCILVGYGPWFFNTTPIFGGTKHWLPAYPFLALFAGGGFVWLRGILREQSAACSRWQRGALEAALGVAMLIAPAVTTWHSHPWGLSAYTPLVGGAPGAATLGLNRTFWGYTTGAVQGYLDDEAPEGARIFVHDTAMDSFKLLQKDHRLRRDFKPWWSVSGSDYALYHHEQHMSRVEHMIWVDYHTTSPVHIGDFDGVPVVWIYERPAYRARKEKEASGN